MRGTRAVKTYLVLCVTCDSWTTTEYINISLNVIRQAARVRGGGSQTFVYEGMIPAGERDEDEEKVGRAKPDSQAGSRS